MKLFLAAALSFFAVAALAQTGDGHPPGLRGSTPLNAEARPAPMPKMINDDVRRGRAFAMQPPVIPHQIENYQVDRHFNKCMTCHARERTPESQAPMVSVTHFTGRDGSFRSEISPSRYFCTQCHVPQMEIKVPVGNSFADPDPPAPARKSGGK